MMKLFIYLLIVSSLAAENCFLKHFKLKAALCTSQPFRPKI
jgi:hypothetical protein